MSDKIFYIFVIPKLIKSLDNIINHFFTLIGKCKILLIDDECDFASNNISNKEESAIFSAINTIYSLITEGKMLSITATPFSNIREQNKNSNDSGKYDRAILFKHSSEYTGSEYFFADSDKYYVYVESSKGDENT
ncbi:MAG: hypothetical protein LBV69_03645 [Bacteroidales bacterium]|jgi:hypothetical protein|nr:hypothetical protein [Bacteroidales bacterium]